MRRVGSEAQQAVAIVALGHCSLDNCSFLPDELKALQEECTADRKVSVADVIMLRTSRHGGLPPVMSQVYLQHAKRGHLHDAEQADSDAAL